mgnify:CR=1 FL=1
MKLNPLYLIHLYTASGGLFGIFALFYAADGNFYKSFIFLFITLVIDGTDGMLARKYKVSKNLPNMDGVMLDNVIDTMTYAWIPFLVMYKLNLFSPLWLCLPALGAMYCYTIADMKNDEGFFINFPTLWNLVALYFWLIKPNAIWCILVLIFLTVLSFLPTRYMYPSKQKFLQKTNFVLIIIWVLSLFYIFIKKDFQNTSLIYFSLFIYPVFYMLGSFYVDYLYRFKKPLNSLRTRGGSSSRL